MNHVDWDIIALINLKNTEDGGRSSATPGKRFKCMVKVGDSFYDGILLLDALGPLVPGFSGVVPIKFARFDLVQPKIKIGSIFVLKEIREIGNGKIVEIKS